MPNIKLKAQSKLVQPMIGIDLITSRLMTNFYVGRSLNKKWYGGIEYFRCMVNQPKKFVDKTILKDIIQYVGYNPILSGLEMMEPPIIIE